jgi:protease-4
MSTLPPNQEGHIPPTQPITVQVVREPPPPPPRRSFFGRFLLVLLLLGLLGSLCLNFLLAMAVGLGLAGSLEPDHRVHEKFFSHNADAKDKVAIISLEGVILDAEDGFVKQQIDQVMKDKSVKAVVLRVDSPGGSVSSSDYLYHHLVQLREGDRKLPIVVSMGGIAASGGYYVAMAAGHEPGVIFAEPTTFTGSIGVIMPHYNVAGLMEKYGVADDSVASNPLKTMGSFTKPMTEDERKIFQTLINQSFAHFKEVVCEGRSQFEKNPKALDPIATGQIYSAAEAKKNGLIDDFGFIEKAIDKAISLAGLDKDNVKVVKYKPDVSLAALFLGGQARSAAALDPKALLEMTTPRAYYLCTGLPGLGAKPADCVGGTGD